MIPATPDWIRAATGALVRSRRLKLWALALVAVSVGLAFVPLFDRLGFGFAFVLSLVASAMGLDLGAALVRAARERRGGAPTQWLAEDGPQVVRALSARAAGLSLALLLIPLALMSANGLRVDTCDWGFGALSFVLMPGLSAAMSAALGTLVGLLLPSPRGRARALMAAAPQALLVGAVGYELWRFYALPPVFSYNLFSGYFPGNLYDQAIDFAPAFYWSRLAQLFAITTALAVAAYLADVPRVGLALTRRPAGPRWRSVALALVAGAASAALWLSAGALGFAVDDDDIKRALGARYDSEHFTIYYPPGGDIARDIAVIAADHEFRYAQVVATLEAAPPARITSYYFADATEKFRWIGARNVYMAKPWRNEIYLNHRPFPHPIVRHEIVHAVAAVFGSPVFRVSARPIAGLPLGFNVGLIEGLAVAADWPDHFTRALTPHQSVKAMQLLELAPPPEQLFSTGFLLFSSAQSYTMAGSFVRFLLDRSGPAPLQRLYRSGGDFEGAYGASAAALLAEWQALIDATALSDRAAEVVHERFRRPGLFRRVCPHAIARARERAAERFARGDAEAAIATLREVCERAPQEPRYQLELAAYLVAGGDRAAGGEIYRALADDDQHITSSVRAEALLALAALAARAGDTAAMIDALDRANALPLGDSLRRNALVQRMVVSHQGPAGPALRAYFWDHPLGQRSDPMVLLGRASVAVWAEPELGLGHYLVGRNLRARGAPREAAAALARALDLGLPHRLVEREAARQLAEAAYQARQPALVERAAAYLMRPDEPAVEQLYGADWLARLAWHQTGAIAGASPERND